MFLVPRKTDLSLEEAISRAKKLKRRRTHCKQQFGTNSWRASNLRRKHFKVKELFGKYAELTGKNLKMLEIPDKAVKKAKEYYMNI